VFRCWKPTTYNYDTCRKNWTWYNKVLKIGRRYPKTVIMMSLGADELEGLVGMEAVVLR
jgi:hypothetical protein